MQQPIFYEQRRLTMDDIRITLYDGRTLERILHSFINNEDDLEVFIKTVRKKFKRIKKNHEVPLLVELWQDIALQHEKPRHSEYYETINNIS